MVNTLASFYFSSSDSGSDFADPSSESLLATATSVNAKHKTIELYNPTSLVEMRFTGLLNFRWTFFWEEYAYLIVCPKLDADQ